MRTIGWVIAFAFFASLVYVAVSLSFISIRLEEAQSVWVATRPLDSVLNLSAGMLTGPLYYLILYFWIQFWGSGLLAIRGLSFIFYFLTLVTLYTLVRGIAGRRFAMATVALFSLSPFVVFYSFDAGLYTLLALITTINHFYFLRIVRSEGHEGKRGYFFTSLTGIYTHYLFLFVIVSQLIYLLLRDYFTWSKKMADYLAMMLWLAILFLPWVLFVYRINGGFGGLSSFVSPVNGYTLLSTFINYFTGFQSPSTQTLVISFWPLLGIIIFLAFAGGEKVPVAHVDYFLLVTFIPLLLILAVSVFFPIFIPRYFIFIAPGLFLLFSISFLGGAQEVSTSLVPIVIALMFLFLVGQTISRFNASKEDYRGLTDYINKNAVASDIIAVSPPEIVYPIEYYYQSPAKLVTIPPSDILGGGADEERFSGAALINQITGYKKTYQKIYVVNANTQRYSPDISKYLDYNYKILDEQKYSPDIILKVYQLQY